MKKVEVFRCEMCGELYETEVECVSCENKHARDLRIVTAKYVKDEYFPKELILGTAYPTFLCTYIREKIIEPIKGDENEEESARNYQRYSD